MHRRFDRAARGGRVREYKTELFRGIYQQGAAEGRADALLTVLAARGIPVSEAIRAQIAACVSPETLDRWLRRAAVASTTAAVVRDVRPSRRAGRRALRGGALRGCRAQAR